MLLSGTSWYCLLGLSLGLLLLQCKPVQTNSDERPLARVNSKYLYPSEVFSLIGTETTSSDSTLMVNSYIKNWIEKQVLLDHVDEEVANDMNVDQMVEDYRNSLMITFYEQQIIRQKLDTAVSPEELNKYYQATLNQFPLKNTYLRVDYLRVDRNDSKSSEFKKLWPLKEQKSFDRFFEIGMAKERAHIFKDSTWFHIDSIAAKMPANTLQERDIKAGKKSYYFKDSKYRYFLKINDVLFEQDPSPLEFVREDLKKIVLKKKKKELLDKNAEAIYQKELDKKNVEIY